MGLAVGSWTLPAEAGGGYIPRARSSGYSRLPPGGRVQFASQISLIASRISRLPSFSVLKEAHAGQKSSADQLAAFTKDSLKILDDDSNWEGSAYRSEAARAIKANLLGQPNGSRIIGALQALQALRVDLTPERFDALFDGIQATEGDKSAALEEPAVLAPSGGSSLHPSGLAPYREKHPKNHLRDWTIFARNNRNRVSGSFEHEADGGAIWRHSEAGIVKKGIGEMFPEIAQPEEGVRLPPPWRLAAELKRRKGVELLFPTLESTRTEFHSPEEDPKFLALIAGRFYPMWESHDIYTHLPGLILMDRDEIEILVDAAQDTLRVRIAARSHPKFRSTISELTNMMAQMIDGTFTAARSSIITNAEPAAQALGSGVRWESILEMEALMLGRGRFFSELTRHLNLAAKRLRAQISRYSGR